MTEMAAVPLAERPQSRLRHFALPVLTLGAWEVTAWVLTDAFVLAAPSAILLYLGVKRDWSKPTRRYASATRSMKTRSWAR